MNHVTAYVNHMIVYNSKPTDLILVGVLKNAFDLIKFNLHCDFTSLS